MWQRMVRRLKASYIWEVTKGKRDKRYVDLAAHNFAKLIIPLVDWMGTQAFQASAKI